MCSLIKSRTFTFRCKKCGTILESDFENKEDIEDVVDDLLWLECPCGEKSTLLRS